MIIGDMEIRLRADIARLQRDMDDARRVVGGAVDGIRRSAEMARAALGSLGVGLSLVEIGRQVITAQREFDKLNASLITATGSTENAAQAFKALQSFASTTPYSVQEATEAFIKMRNLGLDPSEKALRAYGNTASSMGKGLNQMVEAVADAATGEFERLKEFGITARQNGDQVSLTFKGITTNIGNNAKEIQTYLQQLGETDFAGGMARRAATLDGAISNLGDTWQEFLRKVAQGGVGKLANDGVSQLSGAMQDLGAMLDAVRGKATDESKAMEGAGPIHSGLTTVFKVLAVSAAVLGDKIQQLVGRGANLAKLAFDIGTTDFDSAKKTANDLLDWDKKQEKSLTERVRAVWNAADEVQAAQEKEAAARKANGKDVLGESAIVLTDAQKRTNALNALIDVRKKLLGIDPQDVADMKKIQTALDTGAISQAEYNRLKGQLEKQMQANSLAYKQEQKNLDVQVATIQRATAAQAQMNQRQQEHIQFLKSSGQINDEAAINAGADAQIKNFNDQIGAQQSLLAIAKRRQDSQKEQKDIEGQISLLRTQIDNAQSKRDEDLILLEQQKYRQAANNTADLIEAAQAETKAQRDRTRDMQDEIDAIGLTSEQLAELTAARLRDQAAALDRRAELSTIDEVTEAYRRQADELRKQADQTITKDVLSRQKELWGQIESTAHDTFISIFDSGKSAFDRLRDTLKNGLLELLYQMTIKKWIFNIGASVGMTGYGSAAQAANLAEGSGASTGSMSSAVGAAQVASSLYKAVSGGFETLSTSVADAVQAGMYQSGATTQIASNGSFATGAGSATSVAAGMIGGHYLGNAISDGYGIGEHEQAVNNTGVAAGAGIGYYVGGMAGAAIGALIGGAAGGVLNRIFGMGDKEVTSLGMRGTLTADSLTGQNYANWHQDGGWFRSDKDGTDTTSFTADIVKQFTQGLQTIEGVSTGFAKSLGVSTDSLSTYSKAFDIALTGDATKDAQAVTDFFNEVSDEIANKLVPNLMDFSKTGETASATLERLAGDFQTTDQIAQLIGKTAAEAFGAVGIESAKAREQLLSLAGSASTLTSQAQSYAQNYLTEAEKLAPVQRALDAAMESLGLSSVQTRDQFKAVVNSLDLTTEAGAKQFTAMMALADAFAQVHPAADDAATAVQKAADAFNAMKEEASTLLGDVDKSLSVLQKVVDREKTAVQSVINAHTAAVTKLQSLSQSLRGALDSLKAPDQKLAERAVGQAQIRAALAIARAGGPLPNSDDLQDALRAVTQDATSQFSSYTDYLRDLYQTQSDIAQLGDLTDDQLSVEQKALRAAQDQLDRLDSIVANGQAQIDAINGQSVATLSLAQAIAGLQTSLGSAQANPYVSSTSRITEAYMQLLGRAPDAAGLAYWQQAAAGGTSIAQIRALIEDSAEYKKLKGVPGFVGGGDFGGGVRLVGEVGPEVEATGPSRIHSTRALVDAMRNSNSSDNGVALAAAVDRLSATVDRQQATLDQIQRNSRRLADSFDVVTEGGKGMITQ